MFRKSSSKRVETDLGDLDLEGVNWKWLALLVWRLNSRNTYKKLRKRANKREQYNNRHLETGVQKSQIRCALRDTTYCASQGSVRQYASWGTIYGYVSQCSAVPQLPDVPQVFQSVK